MVSEALKGISGALEGVSWSTWRFHERLRDFRGFQRVPRCFRGSRGLLRSLQKINLETFLKCLETPLNPPESH